MVVRNKLISVVGVNPPADIGSGRIAEVCSRIIGQRPQFFYTQESVFINKPILFIYRKMKEDDKVSRAKNPKYESMSLEELKAHMEKSRQELEVAIHNKNLLEQRKKLVERRERFHRLIVKGAEFEKVFPLLRDLEQEEFQEVMNQLQNSSYNKSIVRQTYISASQKDRQQIAEAVKKTEKGDDSCGIAPLCRVWRRIDLKEDAYQISA